MNMSRNQLQLLLVSFVLLPTYTAAWTMPRFRFDLVSTSSHIGASVCAIAELREDFTSIGHGHGILLLGGSKICREVNVLREAMAQEAEELEDAVSTRKVLVKPLSTLVGLLASKFMAISLAVAALAAALVEVFEDISPGGHHGAVLLAINELLEILETARLVKGQLLLNIMKNQLLRLAILGGATAFAFVEALSSVGSKRIGAHHGVLLLASS
jgi:hypothetical protein